MRLIWSSFLALLLVLPLAARADTFLLMAEEHGCPWCEQWDEEISHIYPKTLEGKVAPLRRFDLHSGWPTDLTLDRPLHFTPTFVLVVDGVEKGRIEGYPGEDFFWPMLSILFERAQLDVGAAG